MLWTYVLTGIAGLVAGGVINVLADDLPHYRWPRLPRYPDGSPRPFSAWSGVSAFLLGKRTSATGAKLGWRYPVAEIGTVIFMWIGLAANGDLNLIEPLQLFFWMFYVAVLVLITVIDIEHRLILFAVIIPSCVIAIVDCLLTIPGAGSNPNMESALYGGALGFGVFFILYLGGILYLYFINTVQGRNIQEVAFGYGDVMLATLSGLILGWQSLVIAIFITVFLGAFGALVWLASRRFMGRSASKFAALPYGPYIVAGTYIMLFFSEQVRFTLYGW
jgi:leader peptidase (prepilin peptidase)/N-methyltransferase